MLYRVEVNYNNIGTVLETPFSLNPTRLRYANNPQVWHLLTVLVDISLQNNFKLFDVCHAAVEQNHEHRDRFFDLKVQSEHSTSACFINEHEYHEFNE